MDSKYCEGCYCDPYNHGLGGAAECWSLKTAELEPRRRVALDERPPWLREPETLPDCYHQTGLIFVDPGRER